MMKSVAHAFKILLFATFFLLIINCPDVSHAATTHTQQEAVKWLCDHANNNDALDWPGSGYDVQCVDLTCFYYDYLGNPISLGNGYDYITNAVPEGWNRITYYTGMIPEPGDVVVWNKNQGIATGDGHVAIVVSADANNMYVVNQAGGVPCQYDTYSNSNYTCIIRPFTKDTEINGETLSQGFNRVLPDGDYVIVNTGNSDSDRSKFYYLDIDGAEETASNGTNVHLQGPISSVPPACDVWTLIYNSSDKFYTIKQKGTDMCLEIESEYTFHGAKARVHNNTNSSAQKWAIELNGKNGYRLRAKCSGDGTNAMGLTASSISNNAQIIQSTVNNSNAQSWLFIPYQPTQPINSDQYILLYSSSPMYEVDLPGNTGDLENSTNVMVWNDGAPSQFNSFNVIALSNGYYKIQHAASGRCLDVSFGLADYNSNISNVAVYEDNGSITQQWAIMEYGNSFKIISRCNGYCLDIDAENPSDGANVDVYPYMYNSHQGWNFALAEKKIRFIADDADGNVPGELTKHYKKDVTIPGQVPTREHYTFVCWTDPSSLTEDGQSAHYYPGDIISEDRDIVLYALWVGADSIPIDAAHFPEESFRRYVSEEYIDNNQDGVLSPEERNSVKYITHDEEWEYRLYSLKGIEYFTNLEQLVCYWNMISEVDLSHNTKLKRIAIMYNPLDVLDVSSCPYLVESCANAERIQGTAEGEEGIDFIGPLEVDKRTTVIAGSKVFPARATNPATIIKAPVAKTLVYNGEMQELITAGEAENGLCLYGTDNPAFGFFSDIPKAKDVGEYTIYYRAYGDESYYDSDAVAITARIVPSGSVAYGTCGDSIVWTIDDFGKLTISGTGPMLGDHPWSYGWEEYKDQINTIKIENGITSIGNSAFWNEVNVNNVIIPTSVTTIGNGAFDQCISLTSIQLPDAVTSIGYCAFRRCYALTSINLPRNLISIGEFAFMFCPDVTISIPAGAQMKQHIRLYEGSLCTLSLPATITEMGTGAFLCTSIPVIMNINPDFRLPESLCTLEDEAFSGISATYIYIPENTNGKTTIGNKAFADCKQLQYIWIGNCSEIEISDNAFSGCNSNLIILDDAESVGDAIYEYAMTHGIEWLGNEYYAGDG